MADVKQPRITVPPGQLHWQRQAFDVAVLHKGHSVAMRIAGFVYAGVGLNRELYYRRGRGAERSLWNVTHLNSGHLIVGLHEKDVPTAFALATSIAQLGDWDFLGLDGYKNSEPELFERFCEWVASCPGAVMSNGNRDYGLASSIGSRR